MSTLRYCYYDTGAAIYAILRNTLTETVWNHDTDAWESYDAADWGDYALLLDEQGATGTYVFEMPSAVTSGVFDLEFRVQDGASPDIDDVSIEGGLVEWLGDSFAKLKPIQDKVSLITAESQITTIPLVANGDAIELVKNGSHSVAAGTAITLEVPLSNRDLTDWSAQFGLSKIVDSDGDSSADIAATIEDAGTEDQRIVVEMTKAETDGLAVDNDPVLPHNSPTGRAYKYDIVVSKDDDCIVLARGEASVSARIAGCET